MQSNVLQSAPQHANNKPNQAHLCWKSRRICTIQHLRPASRNQACLSWCSRPSVASSWMTNSMSHWTCGIFCKLKIILTFVGLSQLQTAQRVTIMIMFNRVNSSHRLVSFNLQCSHCLKTWNNLRNYTLWCSLVRGRADDRTQCTVWAAKRRKAWCLEQLSKFCKRSQISYVFQ